MKIYRTEKFAKAYKKVPKQVKLAIEEKEEIFRHNPFDRKLKTHKLKGELKDSYSFSISYHWRIVFHFEKNGAIVLDTIGTHEVYK
ncbi:type II toxin-antitoxin system mRNA interferase toxin, RelE/StbE family [Patescibacteria group bacterium]|nr:type II toxin-antitoxin system mRNA interferase toxin, RelE/StbE family [Patescibacteria group bacterium]